ncbi:MAG: tRNA uridine-5-carboxymethylaminomethyl(34) synthesis GTPase MnmE [Oscillospiraceae bacterium]|nr:tRNA uridine-5-carboxymethylaminomethyl(34) synthesis GTPase MnmE [Oscillospiraceae bacterium]
MSIAAISTPAGAGGIAVLRVSGADAFAVCDKVFTGRTPLAAMAGYTAQFGHVADADGIIDECVALVFRAPRSYTGDVVVELSCHGGVTVARRVLRALLDAGAKPAGPGAFTRRAFENGKLDLTQAEAVAALIGAESDAAARAALHLREGALSVRAREIRAPLLHALAQFDAYIDYPDDDIPDLTPAMLGRTVGEARGALEALLATWDAGRVLFGGVDTVIAGAPNVGKSTLMNCLSRSERSIVTPLPGTTRDVVETTVQVGDVTLRLADTAGLREAADPVESLGVARTKARLWGAQLVLAVFDASRELTENDRALLGELPAASILVLNKIDLPVRCDETMLRAAWEAARVPGARGADGKDADAQGTDFAETKSTALHIVPVSLRTGEGLPALEATIEKMCLGDVDLSAPLLANERQRACVAAAREALDEALEALEAGVTLDAVAVSVTAALDELFALTGEKASDAVLEHIFAEFCVGK